MIFDKRKDASFFTLSETTAFKLVEIVLSPWSNTLPIKI